MHDVNQIASPAAPRATDAAADTLSSPVMSKDQALAALLDQISRAAQVIVSQHRVKRDEATMRRIAGELSQTHRSCKPALDAPSRSCVASAAAWRQQAEHLREHAAMPNLSVSAAQTLLREADAADRQAEWWLSGAGDG